MKTNNSNNSKLQFGALCRVSTEGQAKKGESLAVQKSLIQQAVETLGGKVVQWFGGAEHATEGHERTEIDRLLKDAAKGKFNAFICSHADRWSRDNVKSHAGLEILSKAKIRFFVLNTEYDLTNAEHLLCLEMFSAFGAFHSRHQKAKSIASRIRMAKRGCATSGKIPFGRTYDKVTEKWGIDKDEKAIVEDAAKRYLQGEGLADIAAEHNIDHTNLHQILMKRCGDEWQQTFNQNGEVVVVKTKMPRLLPEATIKALRAKAQANKTYQHGHSKYKYLLSRMIFCHHCNYSLFGQTALGKYKYYRHGPNEHKLKDCNRPQNAKPIRADDIEDITLRYLFEAFGNPAALQKAIQKATPNIEEMRGYEQRSKNIETELRKIIQGRDRILRLVSGLKITEEQAGKQLEALKQREARLQTEQGRLQDNLVNKPDPRKAKSLSLQVAKWISNNKTFEEMTYEEKKILLQTVFSGKRSDGKRLGVFIEWDEKGWQFSIHGHLINEEGLLPLSGSRKEAQFSGFGGSSEKLLSRLSER